MTTLTQPLARLALEIQPLVNGDNILVAAVPGQVIRVYRFLASVGGAVNLKFYSNPSPTNPLTGTFILTASGSSIMLPPAPGQASWFETQSGQSLNLNASAAVNLGGILSYVQL
jgi:hypothetical protein